ncbi:hypothetical protein FQN51_001081 [Onygenales sp. PD_10]|nr:hypothetical protein FQN51_001081 [Onygenales sp. PD_10]
MTRVSQLQPQNRVIRCDVCRATFTRQEHLTRHLRSHTTEKPFKCPECGKGFSRHDVLHRHTQSHASKGNDPKAGPSRACKECAISRTRCLRGNPCERCEQRDLQCVYPVARKRKSRAQSASKSPLSPRTADTYHRDNAFAVLPLDSPNDAGSSTSQMAQVTSRAAGIHAGIEMISPLSATSGSSNGGGWLPLPNQLNVPALLDNSPKVSSEGDPALRSQMIEPDLGEWAQNMPSVNWLSPQPTDTLFPEGEFHWLSFPNMNVDTIGLGLAGNGLEFGCERPYYAPVPDAPNLEPVHTTHPGAVGSQPTASEPVPSESGGSGAGSLESRPPEGTYYVEGSVGRAPFLGRLSGRQNRGPPWRTDPAASAEDQTPASQEAFISESTYDNLLRSILAECDARGIGLDIANMASRSEMQKLVQFYFDGFHGTYPFLRKTHYQFAGSESWLLLLAVAAIGSRYAPTARYHRMGYFLASVVDRVLGSRGDEPLPDGDELPWWTPVTDAQEASELDLLMLQAKVLNCLFLLHCGKRESTRRALVQRYSLIETCNRLKLLSIADSSPVGPTEGTGPEDVVQQWLNRESRIRTGWMIWLLDSIIPYEFSCSALLQIGDAKAPLPCRESIWHCPTADLVTDQSNYSVTLMDALEMLYMEKTLPPNLGELGTNVLIFAICRRTREATIQHQTELTFWSPNANKQPRSQSRLAEEAWPPTSPSLSKWRNSACDCLDILHWAANSTAARAHGWEHPTILHLHVARLLLLAPIQHIQQLATASLARPTAQKSDHMRYMTSRYHVLRWAIRDQYKARLSVIHAGALFWHVRRYSSNSFLEPFGLYAATLVIWAYSTSVQCIMAQNSSRSATLDVETPVQVPVRQDAHTTSPESLDSDESGGDTDPAVIQLDRPCDDEIVQAYICFGSKMSALMSRVGDICKPSAPKKILKQGMRLLNGELYTASGPHSPISNPGDPQFPRWGIELSFLESLRSTGHDLRPP